MEPWRNLCYQFGLPNAPFNSCKFNLQLAMTEQPKIKITLKPGEPVKIEALNFSGNSCTAATEALRQMGESSTELKPEFYDQVETVVNANINL